MNKRPGYDPEWEDEVGAAWRTIRGDATATVEVSVLYMWVMASLVQLGLRHPEVSDRIKESGEQAIRQIMGQLGLPAILLEAFELGFNPVEDVRKLPDGSYEPLYPEGRVDGWDKIVEQLAGEFREVAQSPGKLQFTVSMWVALCFIYAVQAAVGGHVLNDEFRTGAIAGALGMFNSVPWPPTVKQNLRDGFGPFTDQVQETETLMEVARRQVMRESPLVPPPRKPRTH